MKTQENDNKSITRTLMVGAICIALAGVCMLLLTPNTTLATHKEGHNPGGGGGGPGGGGADVGDQPCVILGGGSIDSDNGEPYCNNKKKKVEVSFSNDGHLRLATNSSNKAGAGRGISVDFGTGVTIAPGTTNEQVILNTDQAAADVSGIIGVGAFQDQFDFFDMAPGDSNDFVNLSIRISFRFFDGASDSLLLRLAPNEQSNARGCPSSDGVSVTYDGIVNDVHQWVVETQTTLLGACISRSGEGEFGDSNLLTDVDNGVQDPGHIALSFAFVVTAEP